MKDLTSRTLASSAAASALLGVLSGVQAARAESIVFPADSGIVDVTKAPYGARGDGRSDDTAAIQGAINDCVGTRRPIYFPNGTYLVSSTLTVPLKNPRGEVQWGNTHLQGQSRDRAIIRLRDSTFPDAKKPSPVLTFGPHGSADWFSNSVKNLSIQTGQNNAGAIGLQFFSNNQGCVQDVAIASGDGQGASGLDLGYNDMNGPLLVKNLVVKGFGVGVQAGATVNSQTLEHITLQGQGQFGLRNDGQCLSIRALKSIQSVPAVFNAGRLMCLLDADLQATGAARAQPAIINTDGLYALGIRSPGYARAIENSAGTRQSAAGPAVAEFTSHAPIALFPSAPAPPSARLPVPETPQVAWDEPSTWDSPTKHGTTAGSEQDISAALQAAIDSGASTVYLPTGSWHIGHTIHVRGKVRRIIGMYSYLVPEEPLNSQDAPFFQFDGGSAGTVVLEGLQIGFGVKKAYGFRDNSAQTVVLSEILGNGYRNDLRAGPLFLQDVAAGPFAFSGQSVWARQLNQETEGTHITNEGGRLWILGLKTERGGTLIETRAGGTTQVLGGLSYTTTAGKLAPMFVNDNSSVAVSLGEVCYSGDPFATILRESRGAQSQVLAATDPTYGGKLVLYQGGGAPPKAAAPSRPAR